MAHRSALQVVLGIVAVLSSLCACPVAAAPCAGFVDADDSSNFCSNINWLRNRAITPGCTDTAHFCPQGLVTREQIAAFLARHGNFLPPTLVDANGKAFPVLTLWRG